MELALDEEEIDMRRCDIDWFQSLFSWNLLLMIAVYGVCRRPDYVSILVFVELALDDYT